MANKCANCKLRAKYDQKTTSLVGRIKTNEIRKTFFQPVLISLALWSTDGWEYCKGLFKKKDETLK
jgi:hypothetical protein